MSGWRKPISSTTVTRQIAQCSTYVNSNLHKFSLTSAYFKKSGGLFSCIIFCIDICHNSFVHFEAHYCNFSCAWDKKNWIELNLGKWRLEWSCAGRNTYVWREVAVLRFALTILIFQLSHSNVKRVFSDKNPVKYKLRDQLNIKTLIEVLNTKYGLKFNGTCCCNYVTRLHLEENWLCSIQQNPFWGSILNNYLLHGAEFFFRS